MRIGFWSQSPDVPHWPNAQDTPWIGQTVFLEQLARVENKLTPIEFRGISICRLCCIENGSAEYRTDLAEWPEGLRHYVEKHNVRPEEEFVKYIALTDSKQ